MEQEILIEKIINDFKGVTNVKPSKELFQKIESSIKNERKNYNILLSLAASIVIFISFNLLIIFSKNTINDNEFADLESMFNPKNELYK